LSGAVHLYHSVCCGAKPAGLGPPVSGTTPVLSLVTLPHWPEMTWAVLKLVWAKPTLAANPSKVNRPSRNTTSQPGIPLSIRNLRITLHTTLFVRYSAHEDPAHLRSMPPQILNHKEHPAVASAGSNKPQAFRLRAALRRNFYRIRAANQPFI